MEFNFKQKPILNQEPNQNDLNKDNEEIGKKAKNGVFSGFLSYFK
jgi:hypothetical protein